ncbi:MAG: hypothetical protein WCS37_16400 [Chloroflexota bacterium]
MGYATLARLKRLIVDHFFITRLPSTLLLYRPGEEAALDLKVRDFNDKGLLIV